MLPLIAQMAAQVLLIVLFFIIGRAFGVILGRLPQFSPLWTLAVSFLAVPLCRWLAIQPDA